MNDPYRLTRRTWIGIRKSGILYFRTDCPATSVLGTDLATVLKLEEPTPVSSDSPNGFAPDPAEPGDIHATINHPMETPAVILVRLREDRTPETSILIPESGVPVLDELAAYLEREFSKPR